MKLDTPIVSLINLSRKQRIISKGAFIVGNKFKVNYTITNIGDDVFPGGTLVINIDSPNGQKISHSYEIPRLKPRKDHQIESEPLGILSSGFSLFFAYLIEPGQREKIGIDLAPLFYDELNEIKDYTSLFSIFGQTKEEFYQYWAMIFAAIGLCYFLIKDIIGLLISWISPLCAR